MALIRAVQCAALGNSTVLGNTGSQVWTSDTCELLSDQIPETWVHHGFITQGCCSICWHSRIPCPWRNIVRHENVCVCLFVCLQTMSNLRLTLGWCYSRTRCVSLLWRMKRTRPLRRTGEEATPNPSPNLPHPELRQYSPWSRASTFQLCSFQSNWIRSTSSHSFGRNKHYFTAWRLLIVQTRN